MKYTGSDRNLMPFREFGILFPRSTMVESDAINESTVIKTYDQSNTEQLSRCSVKIGHNDKCFKCRFSVVPGDGPALLRMPDIELLDIQRVMCGTVDNKTNGRKFDSQTKHVADSQKCKTNRDPQAKAR